MNEKATPLGQPGGASASPPNAPTDLIADGDPNPGPDAETAAASAPVDPVQRRRVGKWKSASERMRRRPWLAAGGVVLGVLFLGLSFGNSPVWWPATFRLVGATDFVGLEGVGPITLQFDAVRWSVNGATRIKPDAGPDIVGHVLRVELTPTADAGDVSKSFSAIELQIDPSDRSGAFELRVKRMDRNKNQIKLEVVDGKAHVSVRPPDAELVRASSNADSWERALSIDRSLQIELDTRAASIEFTLPPGATVPLAQAVQVRRLGFAQLAPGADASHARTHLAELVEGTLTFLALPAAELKLSRGSDLRFGGVSAIVEALVLTDETIEFSTSGTADDVRLFFGNQSRSVKPTLLNAATGFAPLMFAVGLAGTCITLLGLYFTYLSARLQTSPTSVKVEEIHDD